MKRITRAPRNLLTLKDVATHTHHWVSKAKKLPQPADEPYPETLRGYIDQWANGVLDIVKMKRKRLGEPARGEPVLLVGNHISYLDIPLLVSQTPAVFVAKKEVASFPVFGAAAKSIGTLFVERESKNSRQQISDAVAHCLKIRRQSVAMFPSGTTRMDESEPWRFGPFKIAKEKNIRIQPFRLRYTPMRTAAYLMEDLMLTHLWKLVDSPGLEATIEFHEPVDVTDPEKDAAKWRDWTREFLR